MAILYGRKFSREELLKRVGSVSQVGGVKAYELAEGREKGVEVIEFRTGSGFNFRVLPGRGMDISLAEFKGIPISWISPTGEVAPEYFEPDGTGWLRSFFGGLVLTCGLTYMGRPSEDGEEKLGLHGRASNIRAQNVSFDGYWAEDEYRMSASGKIVEAKVFGEHICMERVISTELGSSALKIHDTVWNMGFQKTPHMILYHVNIGFPVVDESTEIILPSVKATPRGEEAAKDPYDSFRAPEPGYRERVYYHDIRASEGGSVTAALANAEFDGGRGLGFYLSYNKSELPYFFQWKMNGESVYVVGLEPANALGEGRAVERREGRLQYLEPGEKREYHLEMGVLASNSEIEAVREKNNKVLT